ncbi:RRP15-like protein [Anthophora quadrimaculata]
MIALDNTTKIGKSPKKQIEELEDSDDNEGTSDEDSLESDIQELESASKGFTETKFTKMHMKKKAENGEANSHKALFRGNPGWADVMQKILKTKKPKHKKAIVLSKAKKLCDVKKEENEGNLSFEIEQVKKEIKTEKEEEITDNVQKSITRLKERRKDNLSIRVKPTVMDREHERILQKIATKGVVQLFNAVKQQQGEINKKLSEAGPLERKREQVLKSIDKNTFLDVLMGGSKSIPTDNGIKDEIPNNEKNGEKDKGIWNVLRDDFVMGTKLKDWDRENQDEHSSATEDMDSDD